MNIVAGLPSLNEAATIRLVTQQIDRGLASLGGPACRLLVNIDSGSRDGTVDIFRTTPTLHEKVCLAECDGSTGKGRNVLRFFRDGLERGADAFLITDTDVRTVEPMWVPRMLGPILEGRTDFVSPVFQRSRFRAVNTRAVAHPVLFAWFGADLQQPIGAIAALSRRMVQEVLALESIPSMARWGIDLVLSAYAASQGLRRAEAELGPCDDEADFAHIAEISRDVCMAAIALARRWARQPSVGREPEARPGTFADEDEMVPYDGALEAYDADRRLALLQRDSYADWIEPNEVGALDVALAAPAPSVSVDLWMSVLAGMLVAATQAHRTIPVESFADAVLPFLGMRKATAWEEFRYLQAADVDARVAFGATLLRRKLDARLGQGRAIRGEGDPARAPAG